MLKPLNLEYGLNEVSGVMPDLLRVKPTDYFEHSVVATDENYLYRINYSGGGSIDRISRADLSSVTPLSTWAAIATGFTPHGSYLILESGTHLIIGDVAGTYGVYRSTDGGFTWSLGVLIDWPELAANRGWCSVNGTVYLGEYDGTGSAPTINLYAITNDGTTKTILNTWSTGIKHIHFVHHINGFLYIGTGDLDSESGIIRWDLKGSWSNVGDIAPGDVAADGFIGISGAQRYRTTDIAEHGGYLYSFADAGSGSAPGDRGIWRFNYDLTGWKNLNADILGFTEYAGYMVVSTPEQVLLINYVSGVAGTDNEISIWAARGDVCERIAEFRCHATTARKNPLSFFVDGSDIYLSATPAAGKAVQKGTAVFRITTDAFMGPYVDVVHPAFWLDSVNGVDTNDGYSPRSPKKTATGALSTSSGSPMANGGVLLLEDVEYSETGFTYGGWVASSFPAEANAYLQVRGNGRDKTSLFLNAGVNGITQEGVERHLLLSDMKLRSSSTTGAIILGATAADGRVNLQDCTLGLAADNTKRALYARNTLIKAYRCFLDSAQLAAVSPVTAADVTPLNQCQVELYACIISGGQFALDQNNNGLIKAYNCAIFNYTTAGHIARSATATNPHLFNCVVFAGVAPTSAITPLDDDALLTYTNSNLDFNIMDISSSTDGVNDAEHGQGSNIDPRVYLPGWLYVNPSALDFRYTPDSNALGKDTTKYTEYGYDGVRFSEKPGIGPFGDTLAGRLWVGLKV